MLLQPTQGRAESEERPHRLLADLLDSSSDRLRPRNSFDVVAHHWGVNVQNSYRLVLLLID